MSKNTNLQNAKVAKNDEFYTELSEIEKELRNYKDKFKGKIVFCNCDDPLESWFVKYFLMHFNGYELKGLYATGYKISPIGDTEFNTGKHPYSFCILDTKKFLEGDQEEMQIADIIKHKDELYGEEYTKELVDEGDYLAGDFRSNKSIELLEESDIVVTNPPFSLFREYVAQLIKYKKEFLILGNMNQITSKYIFPLIKNNMMWLGCNNGSKEYMVSFKYAKENPSKVYLKDNNYYTKLGNTCWYTNIDHIKRQTTIPLDLGHIYYGHENQYPKYENYEAINVDRLSDIPYDYMGLIGVPISFIDKYCPEQFEIIGNSNDLANSIEIDGKKRSGRFYINKRRLYERIVIRRKDANV